MGMIDRGMSCSTLLRSLSFLLYHVFLPSPVYVAWFQANEEAGDFLQKREVNKPTTSPMAIDLKKSTSYTAGMTIADILKEILEMLPRSCSYVNSNYSFERVVSSQFVCAHEEM